MKRCTGPCGRELPFDSFYRHSQMRDGYLNKCKDCVRARVSDHRSRNVERVRQYDRDRYRKNPSRITPMPHDRRIITKRNSQRVMRALKKGLITKSDSCQQCGTKDVTLEAAHTDYTKPLDVLWLCRPCHRKMDHANPKTH